MSGSTSMLIACAVAGAACTTAPRSPAALAQNRELTAFAEAAAWPNASPGIVLTAAQEFIAARHERDGYEYFERLAAAQPARPILWSAAGLLQASSAAEIPLLRRAAWVEEGVVKLDRGADADPVVGRFVRGLVLADLPERFGKAKQAVTDLEASLAARSRLPIDIDRQVYRGLARAYHTLGDEQNSAAMLRRAGLDSFDAPAPAGNVSVGPEQGFRFTNPKLAREADGVYVAEGFDFANIAFLVDPAGVIAIDAGTTDESAAAAVRELRKVTDAPIRFVILTHSHWDHIGGLRAVREPGTVVVAREGFARELQRVRSSQPTFNWFFGNRPLALDVKVDRTVSGSETLRLGALEVRLVPARGGETDDALLVDLPRAGLLFVGDVFMPYVGAPFVAEGSPEGYLDALEQVQAIGPRRLIHGHPPLTRVFTERAAPGLLAALRSLHERFLPDVLRGRPIADILHDNWLPDSLHATPEAVLPYLIVRDHFLQRLQRQNAGYWQADGEGLELATRSEWAAVLDEMGDRTDASFARVAEGLLARGDGPLALQVARMGLLRHPGSATLEAAREKALAMLIGRYSPVDPFRFIIYSQWAGKPVRPIADPERGSN